MKKLLLSLLLILASQGLSAQYWVVKGAVADSTDQVPLFAATVVLKNLADSTVKVKATDQKGAFRLTGVLNGNYELSISFVGFTTYKKTFEIKDKSLSLGTIMLSVDAKALAGVTVEGINQRVVQNGDTVEMNAIAYKVNPDATAQDLLEKMPGVVIQNGQVQAQGENVTRVLVDGREFFGQDPNAALTNLPAEIIEKIQVYDEASDQAQFTGFNDGETTKTLNIITKASMRNGTFGKVYGGAGSDNTYNTGGSINLFREKTRLSVIGQMNNINIQNFSTSDLLGVTSGGGRRGRGGRGGGGGRAGGGGFTGGGGGGGRFGNGGNTSDFLVGQQGGISETKAFGLNYSVKPNDKLDIQASYFFNTAQNQSVESIFRQFVLPGSEGQTYQEDSNIPSTNTNHRFSARLEYTINEKNSIQIRPRLTLQENNGSSLVTGATLNDGETLNATNTLNSSELLAYNISNNILWRHRFEKAGRTLSLNLSTAYNQSTGDSFLDSENSFFRNGVETSEDLDQFSELDNPGYNVGANLTYTEPLTEKSRLAISYRLGYQKTDSDKKTFDFNEATGDYTDLNVPLSNTFESIYKTNRAGIGYNLRGEKANFNLNLAYQFATLDNDQTFPFEDNIKRSFENFVPSLNYRYRFARTKNLSISYRTSTSAPSITQLQDVIDNTNPLFVSAGNPNLDQNFTHTTIARFVSTNVDKSTTFFAMIRGSFSDNHIGNSTTIASRGNANVGGVELQPGAQLTQPVNLKGYRTLRSFVSYGIPLGAIKSNLNFTANFNYTRTPELINEELNYSSSPTVGMGWVLSSNISEKIDFTLASNSSYNTVSNTLQSVSSTNYFSQGTRLRLNWIFSDGIVFRSTVNHTYNSGLTDGFNQNFALWNLEVGKKLFKQKGELKLTVFDLLKENQSISRTVNGSYIEDTQSQILTQYFMLTFTFNIRSFGLSQELPVDDRTKRIQEMRQRFGRGGE